MISLKLALRFLFLNKRLSFLMLGVLSLGIVILCSVNLVTQELLNQIKEKEYLKYGAFHGIMTKVSDEQYQQFQTQPWVESVGEVLLYGTASNFNGKNYPVTVGYFDETALDLGRIAILDGRLPQSAEEIAISAFLANGKENLQVGSTTILEIDGEQKHVKISGMINNYSWRWTYETDIQLGKNDYPQIFTHQDFKENKNASIFRSLLFTADVDFASEDGLGKGHQKLFEFNQAFQRSMEDSFQNTNLLNGELNRYNRYENMHFLFSFTLWLGTSICCYLVFQLFYRDFQRKIGIFMSYGARKKHIYGFLFIQILIITAMSALFALPFVWILYQIFTKLPFFIFSSASLWEPQKIQLLLGWFAIMLISMGVIGWYSVQRLTRKSIVYNLRNVSRKKMSFYFYKKMGKLPFGLRYFFTHILSSWKSFVLIMFMLTTTIFLLFISQYMNKIYEVLNEPMQYFLYDSVRSSYIMMEGFQVSQRTYKPFISLEQKEQLTELEGVKDIQFEPNKNHTTLYLSEKDVPTGWRQWYDIYKDTYDYSQTQTFQEILDRSAHLNIPENQIAFPSVVFRYVDDAESKLIQAAYQLNGQQMQRFKNTKSAIIILPDDFSAQKADLQIPKMYMGKVEANEQGDFYFYSETFQPLYIAANGYMQESNGIMYSGGSRTLMTVIFHENQAKNLTLFDGYGVATLHIDENASPEAIQQIENTLVDVSMQIPGSRVCSTAEDNRAMVAFGEYLIFLGQILFLIAGIYALLTVLLSLYSRYTERKSEMALNHANGLSIFSMVKMFGYELLLCFFFAILIGTFFSVFSAPFIELGFTEKDVKYIWLYARNLLIFLAILLLSLIVPYIYLKKQPIMQTLRQEE